MFTQEHIAVDRDRFGLFDCVQPAAQADHQGRCLRRGSDAGRRCSPVNIGKRNMSHPQRVLVSVSDKSGLVPFVQGLAELGFEIVSTGGDRKSVV